MGYRILPSIDREKYTERKGLEGPFQSETGQPYYYDPKVGLYYNSDSDIYLTYEEWKDLYE